MRPATKDETNKKVYSYADLISMPKEEFYVLKLCLKAKAFRLLGINYKKYVKVYEDFNTKALVIEYV